MVYVITKFHDSNLSQSDVKMVVVEKGRVSLASQPKTRSKKLTQNRAKCSKFSESSSGKCIQTFNFEFVRM